MTPEEIIAGPLVDDASLQRAFGLMRDAAAEAAALYLRIPAGHRPQLSPFVDPHFYRALHADVAAAGADPLLHFAEHGVREGRSPHPLIDLPWLLAAAPELLSGADPVAALVAALDADAPLASPYLDAAHLRAVLPPGRPPHPGGLLRRYLAHGLDAGLGPNAWLDPAGYARLHADVPLDPLRALGHFVLHGDAEGRAASERFDGRAYLAMHSDVAAARIGALRHFLTGGRAEGRSVLARLARRRATLGAGLHAAPTADVRPTPEEIREEIAGYHALHARAGAKRAARVAAFVERDVAPFTLGPEAWRDAIATLRLPTAGAPALSILIPARDAPAITAECLLALVAHPPAVPFEVLLVDDASGDPGMAAIARVPGLRVLRLAAPHGFLRACNAGFALLRAPAVLLLNNDAQPLAGALDALLAALALPGVAAVSARLLYPNGRLQEAGCRLSPTGDGALIGLDEDPALPAFAYARDVDYASAACLLLRRDALGDTLFDPAFAPAFCEDADLCLRLRAAGHRVAYEPAARVVHRLSVSTGREGSARKLRAARRSQQVLHERWDATLRDAARVRVLAFHLPQFHPTPENDRWWGAGFTEWTNVLRAVPSYVGHRQPHLPADLGPYDLRAPGVFAAQAALARRYGVAGFCVYYYRFGARRVLDAAFEAMLADPVVDFPFCLCWANENWTRHWDGGDGEVLLEQRYDDATLAAVAADFVRHARDPRQLTVRGGPLFLLYRPLLLPDPPAFAARLRAACADGGLPPPHLAYVEGMEAVRAGLRPRDLGFDAAVEFPPQRLAAPAEDAAVPLKDGFVGRRFDYAATALHYLDRLDADYPRYPGVFPGWDNTPRQPLAGQSFDGATPALFQAYAERKLIEAQTLHHGDARLLFVNAWNEWGEGAHLEPDTHYGHRWLEALHAALRNTGALG